MLSNQKEKSKSKAHCQETRSSSHLSSTRHIRRNLPCPTSVCTYLHVQYRLPYYPASRFECVKVSKEIMKLCKGDFDYKCTSEFIMKYAKFSIVSIKRKHHKIVNTNNNSPSSTRELWDQKLHFFSHIWIFTIFVSVQCHRRGIVHFRKHLFIVCLIFPLKLGYPYLF